MNEMSHAAFLIKSDNPQKCKKNRKAIVYGSFAHYQKRILLSFDSHIHMHDIDACFLLLIIRIGILHKQEIALFVAQIQIIGIIGRRTKVFNHHQALIPSIQAFAAVQHKALFAARTTVKQIHAVQLCDLRIPDALCQMAGL